jgi:hypothetical protein
MLASMIFIRVRGINLHLRPVFPNKALPEDGCLLLQRIARSYGATQTHRLCLSLLFSSLCAPSPTLNDFLLRTYLYIHSPTMVWAIASTTPGVCELA